MEKFEVKVADGMEMMHGGLVALLSAKGNILLIDAMEVIRDTVKWILSTGGFSSELTKVTERLLFKEALHMSKSII